MYRFFFEVSPESLMTITVAVFFLLLFLNKRASSSYRPCYVFTLLSLLTFLLLGAMRAAIRKPQFQAAHFRHAYKEGIGLNLRVLASSKPGGGFYRYVAEVVRTGGKATRGRVFLRIDTTGVVKAPQIGDELLCMPAVREISTKGNPGGFDFKAYADKKGIQQMIWLSKGEYCALEGQPTGLWALANSIRHLVIRSLRKYSFGKEEMAVIQALLLGHREDLSESLLKSYRTAGAVHVLAVSGLHLGILLVFFRFLLYPLRLLPGGEAIRLVCLVLLIWAYALLAGMSASVMRAAAMFSALAVGLYAKRPSSTSQAMVVSFLLLLMADPLNLFDVGFQLSYAAVFGILWFGTLFDDIWGPKQKWQVYPWKLIAVSCSAQLGILPLSLYYFHGFSPLFVFSSLAVIPFMGIVLGLGILVLILSAMHVLPFWLVQGYGAMIYAMNALIKAFSAMETFVVEGIYFSIALTVLLYALLLVLGSWMRSRTSGSLWLLCFLALCFQWALLHHKVSDERSQEFVVFHLSHESLAIVRKGRRVQVYFGRGSVRAKPLVEGYTEQYTGAELEWPKDTNLFVFKGKRILVLDRDLPFSLKAFSPDILVLRNSPPINLERYLREHPPEAVVADGSNYASYVRLWERSCRGENIRFHSTFRDGAYIFPGAP